MIAVDTSIWIDFFRGRQTTQTARLKESLKSENDEAVLTDVVFAEILQGLGSEQEARRVDAYLSALRVLRLHSLDDFRLAAALHRAARRKGFTIRRTSDCLIAAVCIRHGAPLLHADIDFDRLAAVSQLAIAEVPGA